MDSWRKMRHVLPILCVGLLSQIVVAQNPVASSPGTTQVNPAVNEIVGAAKHPVAEPSTLYKLRTQNQPQVHPSMYHYSTTPARYVTTQYKDNGFGGQASPPIVEWSTNGDANVTVTFGPVFFAICYSVIIVGIIFWLFRCFGYTINFNQLIKKISESPTGKSIDLDRVTNLVYEAFDSYGKWAAKEARHAEQISKTK